MANTAKRRIFISYQRQQETAIRELVALLEAEPHYHVWWDQKIGGGKWWDQIIKHIEWSDVVILALSPSYFNSEACRRELQHARNTHRSIVPIIVDPKLDYADIPAELSQEQIAKYFGQAVQYNKLKKLVDTVALHPLPDPMPDAPTVPVDAPSPVPAISKRTILIGLALIFILVITVGILLQGRSGDDGDTLARENHTTTAITSIAADTDETPAVISTEFEDLPETVEETIGLPAGDPGPFDIDVIYGNNQSLTIAINAVSNLNGVELRTFEPEHTAVLTNDFTILQATDGTIEGGVCLIYELVDSNPRRPIACSDTQNFIVTLQSGNIFWFDRISNGFADLAVYQAGRLADICAHQNGSGICNITEP